MSSVEPVETAEADSGPLSELGQWARDASDAYRVARSLAPTEFVPDAMRNRPELVTAAILAGIEIGLQPMAALRSFDIVKGTPTMRANTLRGLVQAAGHEVWIDPDSNETRAIAYGRRRGSDITQRSVWSMERARGLGIADRDNYRKQPGVMLVARATAEVCRLTASDVTLGLYAAEEIDDTAESAAPAKPKTKRRTAKRQPVEPEAPPLEEPEEPAPEQPAAGDGSSTLDTQEPELPDTGDQHG